jgi:hypothetical protein
MCFACSPFAGALAEALSRRSLLKHTVGGCRLGWVGGSNTQLRLQSGGGSRRERRHALCRRPDRHDQ